MKTAKAREQLIGLLADLDEEAVLALVQKRINTGDDPLQIIADCNEGMRQVGQLKRRRAHRDRLDERAATLLGCHHVLVDQDVDGAPHGHGADAIPSAQLRFRWQLIAGTKRAGCHTVAQNVGQLGISRLERISIDRGRRF